MFALNVECGGERVVVDGRGGEGIFGSLVLFGVCDYRFYKSKDYVWFFSRVVLGL